MLWCASPLLTFTLMRWLTVVDRDQYLPNSSDRSHPSVSPILASDDAFKQSTSRVHIAVAELDLLRSEGEAYAAKLKAFGKDVTLKVYPGVPHLIQAMDGVVDTGRLLVVDLCREVAKNFGRHPQDVSLMVCDDQHGVPMVDH